MREALYPQPGWHFESEANLTFPRLRRTIPSLFDQAIFSPPLPYLPRLAPLGADCFSGRNL